MKKIKGFEIVGDESNTIWDTLIHGTMTQEKLDTMYERLKKIIGFDVNIELKAWSPKAAEERHITFAKAWTKAEIKTKEYMEGL